MVITSHGGSENDAHLQMWQSQDGHRYALPVLPTLCAFRETPMTTFTVITATLNALPLLKNTAASIVGQSFADWQWIIIDGASTDGTPEWLRETSRNKRNCIFICEPDKGIYDAWNKALPHIQGEWVLFLGAGDRLRGPDTLDLSARLLALTPQELNLAYGRVEFIDSPESRSGELNHDQWEGMSGQWAYGRPRLPSHPAIFHRSRMFKNGVAFDPSYRIAGDTAILLKELLKNGGQDITTTIALVLRGGVSQDPSTKSLMLREVLRANREAGILWNRIYYQYAALVYHSMKAFMYKVKCIVNHR